MFSNLVQMTKILKLNPCPKKNKNFNSYHIKRNNDKNKCKQINFAWNSLYMSINYKTVKTFNKISIQYIPSTSQ